MSPSARLYAYAVGFVASLVAAVVMVPSTHAQPIYQGNAYTLTDTSVVQGRFRADAPSRTALTSTYQRERTAIKFKFSINGRDNERPSGDDLRIRLDPAGGRMLTPVYVYGERPNGGFPQPTTVTRRTGGDSVEVVFRVDMRPMLRAFRDSGVYQPPRGAPVREADFQGVYVLGDTDPLVWDRDAVTQDRFRLTDEDGDGVYRVALRFKRRDVRPLNATGLAQWSLSEDVSAYPQYRSDQRLVDALYALSLEELKLDIRDDGAFMAGAKWTGVWTRDVAYSILLSLALADPDGAKTSLLAKVTDDGRIVQDTGTGGSWPVSSDRMTWALAAWETYLTTGDRDWLRRAYHVVRRSVEDDQHAVVDSATGLVRGESSFMDWRGQSYPAWMQPADIYQSQSLSTNVVHYRTYRILADMAETLGEPSERWADQAASMREAINEHFWMTGKGYYAVFRYGRNHLSTAPRAEGLGAALAIVTGVAEGTRGEVLSEQQPVVDFGTPSYWPYEPGIPPYHNAGIWPFVSSYWTWASAEAQNTEGVEHGLASIYRAAALFLTNKENMVAQTGHFEGTQINSDRQLWSVAGNLATVYRVFFGMRFTRQGLRLQPFVPEGYTGIRRLTGVRYRGATLNLEVRGHGNSVVQVTLDGEPLDEPLIPASLTGRHDVRVVLNGGLPDRRIEPAANRYAPATPQVAREDGPDDGRPDASETSLVWAPIDAADRYVVYRNGVAHDTTTATRVTVPMPDAPVLHAYQVQAVGQDGLESFKSEPVRIAPDDAVATVQPPGTLDTEASGYTGDGYLPLTLATHTTVQFQVTVNTPGHFALDVRYANGSGPVNTDNKCALRTVRVDGAYAGPLVMPQRGDGMWDAWGYSAPVHVDLDAGTHTVTVVYTDADRTMSDDANAAHLDHLRVTRLEASD